MHALRKVGVEVGRGGLCRLLGELASDGEKVCVVFDGRSPDAGLADPVEDSRITVIYSGRRSADAVICEHIAADTAPRRLTVVSTDRQIRKAGRRRRCKLATSEEFAESLLRPLRRADRPRRTEPPEKRRGLTPEQARSWLRELDLDSDAQH